MKLSQLSVAEGPDKRVFTPMCSAFAGQQRYAAVTWSWGIAGTYSVFAAQIPTGLNFSLSDIPYWTTDIASYITPLDLHSDAYQELYARWFQFGVFCPIDARHILTIGDRDSSFSLMRTERTINIVLVRRQHGVGETVEAKPDATVTYRGRRLQVHVETH